MNIRNENKAGDKAFNPLLFLMSLGAGGIAVMPFAFFQYTIGHGGGLVAYGHIAHGTLPLAQELLVRFMELVMVVFTIIHFVTTYHLLKGLFRFLKTQGYKEFIQDSLKNSAIMAPFISIIMTMNVFIGPIRYFIPPFSNNLQVVMLPALLFWAFLWVLLVRMEMKLLRISFTNGFDIGKMNFGWLLHPFALGMLTVVGTGLAAFAENPAIAHVAAFMSIVTGTMGFFLLVVKSVTIFKSHLAANGVPGKKLLPNMLIVIPNITLFTISAFRLGHYMEHHHAVELTAYFKIVITTAFAFETWYVIFGLTMLKDYFRKDFFKKEFYVSQWGLICPVVAYAVLGSFLYKVFLPNPVLYAVILLVVFTSVALFGFLANRHARCSGLVKNSTVMCN